MSGNDEVPTMDDLLDRIATLVGVAIMPSGWHQMKRVADALEASLAPEPAGDERALSDGELLEIEREAIRVAMSEEHERTGFASNMSRTSIIAGLRAVADAARSHPAPAATVEEVAEALSGCDPEPYDAGEWEAVKYYQTIATALTAQFDMRRRDT